MWVSNGMISRLSSLYRKSFIHGTSKYVPAGFVGRRAAQAAVLLAAAGLLVYMAVPNSMQALSRASLQWKYSNAIPAFTGKRQREDELLYDKDYQTFRYVFDWLETPTADCKSLLFAGGTREPAANASRGWLPVCTSTVRGPTAGTDCLVYGFGVDGGLTFERAMAARGCQVHAFDPRRPERASLRAAGVTFYRLALHRLDGQLEGRALRTLDTIVDDLDHGQRTISYLKLDIDFDELYLLLQQLLDKDEGRLVLDQVHQIGINLHLSSDVERFSGLLSYSVYEASFRILQELGFRLVFSAPNADDGPPREYLFPGVDRAVYTSYKLLLVRTGRDVWDRMERGQNHIRREFVH